VRSTRRDYRDGPGSFDRIREAAYALADASTEVAGDAEFHRADMRLRAAVHCYLRQVLRRIPKHARTRL
jgi:hypothetical protein